jgi:hypothetical protein
MRFTGVARRGAVSRSPPISSAAVREPEARTMSTQDITGTDLGNFAEAPVIDALVAAG